MARHIEYTNATGQICVRTEMTSVYHCACNSRAIQNTPKRAGYLKVDELF